VSCASIGPPVCPVTDLSPPSAAAVQPLIQSVLVGYELLSIATCTDVPYESYNARNTKVSWDCQEAERGRPTGRQRWHDPEPGTLAAFPRGLVVPRVMRKLCDMSGEDTQSHLWPEINHGNGTLPSDSTSLYADRFVYWEGVLNSNDPHSYYASALPRLATTGTLRYHALRQHTTVRCAKVAHADFPTPCPGDSPFTTNFSAQGLDIKVCAAGALDRSPWTLSRNRQNVVEDMWIDAWLDDDSPYGDSARNWTVHCATNSSRGYFEVGSKHNGNMPGPLLETWPSKEALQADFNDAVALPRHARPPYYQIPSET